MVLLDTAAMADLHMRWMDLPGPTDVMSFPMDELEPGGRPDAPEPGPSMLGDIVLCPEFAAEQAEKAGHSLGHELALLTVHGVLHLLGYDHAEPDEEKEMFALQGQLLEEWVADQVAAYHQDRQTERDRRLLDKSRYLRPSRDRPRLRSLGAIAAHRPRRAVRRRSTPPSARSRMARVEEMVRDERPGAVRLARIMADRPRYINLVVLLRITCEISATVLLVAYLYERPRARRGALFVAAAIMVVVSFVVIGVGPRTLGRQNAYSIALVAAASAAGDLGAAHPDQPAAGADRQRAHPGPRLPQRPVRLRDRAARGRRPGPAARRGGRRRAADDPVGLRTRRHPGPRGDGAAHRDGVDRGATRPPARRRRWPCAAGIPGFR